MTRRSLLLAVLGVLVVALAGGVAFVLLVDRGTATPAPAAASASAPTARAVSGTLTLTGEDDITWSSETGCAGTGGYDDIRAGAQVVITDSAGATVALGKLDQGKLDGSLPGRTADLCKFTFALPSVPTGHGFYGVEIANRGRVQYPEQQLFGALSLMLG